MVDDETKVGYFGYITKRCARCPWRFHCPSAQHERILCSACESQVRKP